MHAVSHQQTLQFATQSSSSLTAWQKLLSRFARDHVSQNESGTRALSGPAAVPTASH